MNHSSVRAHRAPLAGPREIPKRMAQTIDSRYFKKRLEEMRQQIMQSLQKNVADTREVNSTPDTKDMGDLALSNYTKEYLFQLSDNDRVHLQNITDALARIEEGSYGECIDCGGAVPKKRLEVVPWALRCTKCQEIFEQTQVPSGRTSFGTEIE